MAKIRRSGLGKGLDSLIPEGLMEENEEIEVKKEVDKDNQKEICLNINLIEPNREQPRKNFDEEALEELADSIRQFGILQPLLVRKKDDYFEIIAGERRWRAAKLAQLKEVPVLIKEYSEQEMMEISLIENIQRENLNPIEEAAAYQRLIQEFNLKHEEIAERVSKSRAAVTNSMRLLKLDKRVQMMVAAGELSMGHARALLVIEDKDLQFQLGEKIVEQTLSVRDTEKMVKAVIEPPKKKEKEDFSRDNIVYHELENKIRQIMGTKVSINRKTKDKGKIEIEYYSVEELERIMELFETMN